MSTNPVQFCDGPLTCRTEQVETLLKTQDPSPTSASPTKGMGIPMNGPPQQSAPAANLGVANPNIAIGDHSDRWRFNGESPQPGTGTMDDFNFGANMGMPMNNVAGNFTWEMIGLGLEEPLPPQETIDELHQIYFEKVHPSVPMVHRFRYLAAMNL